MIINTGCRTDIPAFYSKWLMNRIKEGYVLVRNPYNNIQVTKYRLSPDVIDCLAFCTKNPEPMLKYLGELDKYKQYWFVTITPYGKDIEPAVPNKEKVIESFKKLSEHIGIDSIGWRYDPIFIAGVEVSKKTDNKLITNKIIEKGKYAKFVITGDVQNSVGQAWQEIWNMNLKRKYTCDFEEYQNNQEDMQNQEIHIFIALED